MSENVGNAPHEEASRTRLLAFVNGDESAYRRATKVFNPRPGMPATVEHRDEGQLRHDVHALIAENGRLKSGVAEAIALLEDGTAYERLHVVGTLRAALGDPT